MLQADNGAKPQPVHRAPPAASSAAAPVVVLTGGTKLGDGKIRNRKKRHDAWALREGHHLPAVHEAVLACGGAGEGVRWARRLDGMGPRAVASALPFAFEWARAAAESSPGEMLGDLGGGGQESVDLGDGVAGHINGASHGVGG